MLASLLCAVLSATPPAVPPKEAPANTALRDVAFHGAQLSPDGRWVAWAESVSGPQRHLPHKGRIFLLDLAGGRAPRRITAGSGAPADEGGLAWAPDGRRLTFLSDARSAGQQQLYVMDVAGSGARALTRVRGGLLDPHWSPDGRRLAFLFLAGVASEGPMGLAPREVGVIQEEVTYQRIAVVDAAGGELRLASPDGLHVYELDWAPDGRTFAAVAAAGPGDQSWWIAKLYTVPAEGGPARLLYEPALQIAVPRWAPDGKSIAFIEGLMSDEGLTGGDVILLPAEGGKPRNLTPGRPASPGFLAWTGADELAFAEWVDGQSGAAVVHPSTGQLEALWQGPEHLGPTPYTLELSVARDGTAAAISHAFERGPELFTGPLRDRARWTQRTQVNASVKPPWRARSLRWKSDGEDVQGWLVEPLQPPEGRGPLVVMVHGGPTYLHHPGINEHVLALVRAGYRVLLPNPRGSMGHGTRFASVNRKDFGGGDLRDILAGLDAALAAAPIDPQRVGMFGWSYGGFMTMWTSTQTDRFQAYVEGAGITNWQSYYGTNRIDTWMIPFFGASVYDDPQVYRRASAIEQIKRARAPTLLLHGERDSEVPTTQSFEHWHALKALGVPTQLVVYPDEGHVPTQPEHERDIERRMVEWFNRWLPPPGRGATEHPRAGDAGTPR